MYSYSKLPVDGTLHGNGTLGRSNHRWKLHIFSWGFQLPFFLISLFSLLTSIHYRNTAQACNCEDHMPMYSPALEAIQGTGHFQRFDGSFATPNTFKGTPSSELDDAWANITYEKGTRTFYIVHQLSTNLSRRCYKYIRGDIARRQCFD